LPCPVYDRARLTPAGKIAGPAIIEQMDATTYVLPGQTCAVDRYGNLIIRER
jgi:N-methylhydantoinase A